MKQYRRVVINFVGRDGKEHTAIHANGGFGFTEEEAYADFRKAKAKLGEDKIIDVLFDTGRD